MMKTKRRRIVTGTLVSSSNDRKYIISKRLIIKVRYKELTYKVLDQQVCGIRTSYEQ
jgi:hypothetical protein